MWNTMAKTIVDCVADLFVPSRQLVKRSLFTQLHTASTELLIRWAVSHSESNDSNFISVCLIHERKSGAPVVRSKSSSHSMTKAL